MNARGWLAPMLLGAALLAAGFFAGRSASGPAVAAASAGDGTSAWIVQGDRILACAPLPGVGLTCLEAAVQGE